jgi:hypothetical protein
MLNEGSAFKALEKRTGTLALSSLSLFGCSSHPHYKDEKAAASINFSEQPLLIFGAPIDITDVSLVG